MRTVLAALLVCVGSSVGAQDARDGVFVHNQHQIRFEVPKDWTLRTKDFQFNWGGGSLAEFADKDGDVSGILFYEASAMRVDRYADTVEKNIRALPSVKSYKKVKEEKPEGKKAGAWLVREYEMDVDDNDWHRVCVFINKGKHDFNFSQWCPETQWDDLKERIYKNVESLRYGEEALAEAPTPAAAAAAYTNESLGVTLAVPDGWATREKDFQCGDKRAVLEMQKGEAAYGVLAVIDGGPEVKAWAQETVKAYEGTLKNFKMLDSRTVGACERRDFRADVDGVAARFAILLWTNAAKKKGVYLYFWTAEADWDAYKDVIENALASYRTGGAPPPGDKPPAGGGDVKPAAGDGLPVPEDAWKGCGTGSTVKYKMVSSGTEMEMTYVLVEHRDGESYTMRTDMVMGGNTIPGQNAKFVVKKLEAAGKPPEGQDPPQIEQGEETIKVLKGEFKCKWTKTTTKQGWSKVWMNDDVPFRMVKTESAYGPAKTSMELVDFEKK